MLGANLSTAAARDRWGFPWSAERDKLPALLQLLREVMRYPTFPEQELSIFKRSLHEHLEKGLTEPGAGEECARSQTEPISLGQHPLRAHHCRVDRAAQKSDARRHRPNLQ